MHSYLLKASLVSNSALPFWMEMKIEMEIDGNRPNIRSVLVILD
jgi:hypothetical protein